MSDTPGTKHLDTSPNLPSPRHILPQWLQFPDVIVWIMVIIAGFSAIFFFDRGQQLGPQGSPSDHVACAAELAVLHDFAAGESPSVIYHLVDVAVAASRKASDHIFRLEANTMKAGEDGIYGALVGPVLAAYTAEVKYCS